MKDIRLRDLPSFIRTTDSDDVMLNYIQRLIHNNRRADAILFNSFDPLEHDIFNSLSANFPPLYTLGPFQLMLDCVESNDEETKSISTSLWKEDPYCLEWLDSHAPNSVVYVNYGSITVMTNDQFVEFAWGLANTNLPFLWITRPDLITGDVAILPPEFLEVTKDRGLITSWCNQLQVLAHPAIGGFLTHCGWNSTIESLINGVPMICWPFFAEQQTNCWFSCNKWGVGMEIDVNVKRGDVEKQVMDLMEGEKGKDMKRKAMEWKRRAHEVVATPNGTSHNNLDNLIKMLASLK
ncbi:7-deoxyloganetin glucosyltransferase [Bienertia sinuspersici]